MLIRWSNEDPVSEKEIDRNNAVYALQHNRNPFIDYPELAGLIWGADSINSFQPDGSGEDTTHTDTSAIMMAISLPTAILYPNPATTQLNLVMPIHSNANIVIYNVIGKAIQNEQMNGYSKIIDLNGLPPGLYFLKMSEQNRTRTYKFTICY
jgi:hypothetical protein